jgi:hypothetical protein
MELKPNKVNNPYLIKLELWVKDSETFTSSAEGRAFALEMEEVIRLARVGLKEESK